MTTIGSRLRKLREAKGLLQREVAAVLGTTSDNYSNYERDVTKNIPDENLIILSNFLDTSLEYITGDNDIHRKLKHDLTSMKSFGEKLRGIREGQGLTMSYVADYMGIHRNVYARYENGGARKISDETMVRLAKALNVPLGTLARTLHSSEITEWLKDEQSVPWVKEAYQRWLESAKD